MASRRHNGAAAAAGGGAGESQPLLGGSSSSGPHAGAVSAAGGWGGGRGGGYGSGEQHKALTDDPPDLGTFNQTSSMYHLPGSRRRSSWVFVEKPPIRTIDILRKTRRHRLDLGVFLLATLLFITVAIVHRAGWALGHIVTTSVLMPKEVDCPPQLEGAGLPGGECEASKILVYNTRVNYGLFGRLKYATTAEASVHTQLKAKGGQTRAALLRTSEVVTAELQEGYQYWGQEFPTYMRHVRATQALVLASWLATCLSLLLLGLVSFRAPASKLATTNTMRTGCAGLIISALALALAMVAWLSIPVSAFSTMCLPAPVSAPDGDGDGVGVACTRLDEAYCEDNCHVDNQVVRTGSVGCGLVLFSALLQCMCAVFWHKLELDVHEVCDHNCHEGHHSHSGTPPHTRQRSHSPVLGSGVHLSGDSHPIVSG